MPTNDAFSTPGPQTGAIPPALIDDKQFTTTLETRLTNLAGVVIPLVALALAIILLWGFAFNWVYLILLLSMYVVTTLGITIGYHRFFTHKSFDTPRWIQFLLGVLGGMAAQGSILEWAAVHRRHHQHSDGEEDPHSPHAHGDGVLGMLRGMWHAHIGWMFVRRPEGLIRYVGDLRKDTMVRSVSKLFPLWVILGMLVPALLAGLVTWQWHGLLLGFIWGGLVRIGLVHHITWSVNSVCHIWGGRPYRSHDESRNNPVFGILAMGEGWHNNHHAFPTSARHGLAWWQFDLSYVIIRGLALVGLASNVRVPAREAMAAKRRA